MIYRQIGCLDELLQNYLYSGNIFYEGKLALTTVFHPASLCRFHMQLVRHFLLDKLCFKPWFTAQSGLQLSLAMCLIMFHLLVLCGTYLLMRMLSKYFIVEETYSELDCDIFQQVPFH